MKRPFTWMMGGMLLLGAVSCAEKKSTVTDLAVRADASELAGQTVSTAQAVEWTHRFQHAHPEEMWAAFSETDIFTQLLSQDGCQGITIYHGTRPEGGNTFVMTGVDGEGKDMSAGKIADEAHACPSQCSTTSILLSSAREGNTPVVAAGAIIPLDQALDLTRRYHEGHPEGVRGGYFSAHVYKELLAQPGCVGIRVYNGLKEGNEECYVLVGVDGHGNDLTDGLLYDMANPCPPNHLDSVFMQ